MVTPEVPVIVEDAEPGSAGAALNAYAAVVVNAWAESVNAEERGEGIYERSVDLESYDDVVAGLEAERDRLTGLGLDVTTDPLP